MKFTLRRPMDALFQPVAQELERPTVLATGTEVTVLPNARPFMYKGRDIVAASVAGDAHYYVWPFDLLVAIAEDA